MDLHNEMDAGEQELIERIKGGEQLAFRELVVRYQGMVFSVALRLLGSVETAEDVVQETFIRVWQHFSKYDSGRSIRIWIYTIATRICLDMIKKDVKTERMPEANARCLQTLAEEQNPHHVLENREIAEAVTSLTSQLSPKQRIVFALIYLEGLTPAEVEDITGMDAGRIKRNLYAAKEKIKEQLKRMGYG